MASTTPDVSAYRALVPGRPWVLGVQNQVVQVCGVGLCDAIMQNNINAVMPFIYSSAVYEWNATEEAGNPGVFDLVIPAGTSREFFSSGIGEPIEGGWWINTLSDANAFKGGAGVNRGFQFLATGMCVDIPDPFTKTDENSPEKGYPAWMQQSDDGVGYSFLITKFMINYLAFTIAFGDTGQTYNFAPAGAFPHWGFPSGSQTVRIGQTAMPGAYVPFTTGLCLGDRYSVKDLTMTGNIGNPGGRVFNNPSQQVGFDSIEDSVYVQVRVWLIGYIVCVPFENYCGIPTLTADEVIALRARIPGLTGGQ